jgi:hypothetical protein
MNESDKKEKLSEAFVGLFFIFAILIFLLFKFGKGTGEVRNNDFLNEQNLQDQSKQDMIDQLSEDQNKDLYKKYIKQIYDAQNGSGTAQSVDQIVNNYQVDLQQSVTLPDLNLELKDTSNSYTQKQYSQDFEKIFTELKKLGGTEEGKILSAQIQSDNTLLTLSDFDKQTILRDAVNYDIFADKVLNLQTPAKLQTKAITVAQASKNISTILKKLSNEQDPKVYSLWISKYLENLGAIIAIRYAIQQ